MGVSSLPMIGAKMAFSVCAQWKMPKTESYRDRPQMQMLYYRNGYFQVTRNAEANSYRLGWYPGMVSATQAPFFVAPLWQLFNQSLVTGIVPSQWNTAIITPVAKVPYLVLPNRANTDRFQSRQSCHTFSRSLLYAGTSTRCLSAVYHVELRRSVCILPI